MEAPVLYFYLEKEMAVSGDVSFASGSITETYPPSQGGKAGVEPITGLLSYGGKWIGKLHPPVDHKVLAEIPGPQVQPHFPQVEKFIFYCVATRSSL